MKRRCGLLAACLALAACASGPPPPDWATNAQAAMQRTVSAYLAGDSRIEALEYAQAQQQIARSGRIDLLARAALMRCAAQVASLNLEPCADFDALRNDASEADRAYADYLRGMLQPGAVPLLPAQHRATARAVLGPQDTATEGAPLLAAIDDPLARLVAAGVLLQAARSGPQATALAVDAASAQGWRRPLLAWLQVQLREAESAGDGARAAHLRRRIGWVGGDSL